MATLTRVGPETDGFDEVIDWYRTELAKPAEFPWSGCEWEPKPIGPTWETTADGHWLLPDASIGWEVFGWTGTRLQLTRGEPWRYTLEQARWVLWWFAVDEAGQFLYRDAVFQRLKGAGKDPLLATLAAVEMLGPARFLEWDGDLPVATDVSAAWIQLAAVSLEQTKNTTRLFPLLFTDEAKAEYGLRIGKEVIYALGDERMIQAVTSSPATLEGARATFTGMNEALALDTPLPTPKGWTTMGDVSTGDVLIDEAGQATRVTATKPVQTGRPCYKVHFADGSAPIIASDGHLWLTKIASSAAKPKVRTTAEMAEDGRRFRIPSPAPWQTDPIDLSTDPYLLGLWLGDGSTGQCYVTAADDDLDFYLEELRRRGVPCRVRVTAGDRANQLAFSEKTGFGADMGTEQSRAFRKLLCYRDKHIPVEYLRAGTGQRLDLLRGLVDSDGCVTKTGSVVFVNSSDRLTAEFAALARTLGQRPRTTWAPDTRSRCGGTWRVVFTPTHNVNPALLPRKAARHRSLSGQHWVTVTKLEEVEPVPVRCISVDSPNRLFLAGTAALPTHNTHHWLSNNEGHEMAAVIERNATKSADGAARTLAVTNAYEPSEESVAQHTREAWDLAEAGGSLTTGLLYDSLEAPPEAPLSAEAAPAVVAAVRGDSFWLDTDRIVQSILDTRNPPSRSRRFWYNQIVAAEDAWLDPQQFDACAKSDILVKDGDTITMFFDGSKSDDASALVGCRLDDGHVFTIGMWQRPPGERGHGWLAPKRSIDDAVRDAFERYDVAVFWADPGHTRDDVTDESYWDAMIDEWHHSFKHLSWLWAHPKHAVMWDMTSPLRTAEFTTGAERCVADIEESALAVEQGKPATFTHDGDARLRRHAHNARRFPNRYGVSMWKGHRESARKIDLAVCMVGARLIRRRIELGEGKRPRTGAMW